MCTINASQEMSSASTNIISVSRKCSTISCIGNSEDAFFLKQNRNADTQYITTSSKSINNVRNNIYKKFALIQEIPSRKMSDIEHEIDHYGFSYHRSNRNNGSQDAVLLKDVGISCSLLKKKAFDSDTSTLGIENYLLRKLKLEYNELSDITRKLNAYTKDILSNLASKCRRRDHALQNIHVVSKHVMASQYIDEVGNPCLKLRFCNNKENKYQSSQIDLSNSTLEMTIIREKIHESHANTKKRRVEVDKIPKKKLNFSPKYSSMLLHNYLIMKRKKVSSSASRGSLRKTGNSVPLRLCRDCDAHKSRKIFYTNKCDPVVLTNWEEVSRRNKRRSKNAFTASISKESRCIVNCI